MHDHDYFIVYVSQFRVGKTLNIFTTGYDTMNWYHLQPLEFDWLSSGLSAINFPSEN